MPILKLNKDNNPIKPGPTNIRANAEQVMEDRDRRNRQRVIDNRKSNYALNVLDENKKFNESLPFGVKQLANTVTAPMRFGANALTDLYGDKYTLPNNRYWGNNASSDLTDTASALAMSTGVTGARSLATELVDEATLGVRNIPKLAKSVGDIATGSYQRIRYGDKLLDVSRQPDNLVASAMSSGKPVSLSDKLKAGRDNVIMVKPNRAYRSVSDLDAIKDAFNNKSARFKDFDPKKSKEIGEENFGLDWYLGGYAPKYGNFVIETPAVRNRFVPVLDNLAKHKKQLHLKSDPSGTKLSSNTKYYQNIDGKLVEINPETFN